MTIVTMTPVGTTREQIVPHGHVKPRGDGIVTRCGGPALCRHCKREQEIMDAGHHPYVEPEV